MSRNNAQNIKKHNEKLHKAASKDKKQKVERKAQLKAILKKFNEDKSNL